jgi:hypothetical protein
MDAGVGAGNAGVVGLPYLDQIGLPAATASADSCHIGDGDHTLAHGIISHVSRAATVLGCGPGRSLNGYWRRSALPRNLIFRPQLSWPICTPERSS